MARSEGQRIGFTIVGWTVYIGVVKTREAKQSRGVCEISTHLSVWILLSSNGMEYLFSQQFFSFCFHFSRLTTVVAEH